MSFRAQAGSETFCRVVHKASSLLFLFLGALTRFSGSILALYPCRRLVLV